MFCPKCGTKNADEAKFCVECGATLPSHPQASTAAPQASPAPQPTSAPKPQPNPFATPKQQASPFGANAPAVLSSLSNDPVTLAGIVAGIVMVLSFFLPLVSLSAFDYSYSMSALDMTGMGGVLGNLIFLIPGIAALLVAFLVKKPMPRAIAQIVIGVITIIFFILYFDAARNSTYGIAQMSLAFYLFIICAIVLIACGIKTILDNKKATPTF